MKRREFFGTLGSTGLLATAALDRLRANEVHELHEHCHPTYATPQDAIASEAEKYAFVCAIHAGTPARHPDYMATVDVDPSSPTYSQVVGRFSMPQIGDELHHYGWNACSSCHGERHRRYLVVPGLSSGNVYIIDAVDPVKLKLHKTITAAEIAQKTDLSVPHTVHCRDDGVMMISMLGDTKGNAPGGFLEIDDRFNVVGRWEKSLKGMSYNYDFWYQPRHNVMVSSEWAAPNTVRKGFHLEDVAAGKYGHQLHFWDWDQRRIKQTLDLGEDGVIPLEVRFHHDPDSTHGFVGAALSSTIFHWYKVDEEWKADKIVQVEPVETEGWSFPVPGLVTDIVLSLDDRYLYFSNWLHGDVRQYDVSDPAHPRLVGQVWLGGLIGHDSEIAERQMTGGPQMLQLSLDGKRLYVTSSLFSVWDDQFYPQMASQGSWMVQIDCDTEKGGMAVNDKLFVDFGKEPWGPVRTHQVRFPSGDSTSDIWV